MLVAVAANAAVVLGLASAHSHCRCLPDHPCWPSSHHWGALNGSVHGRLEAVKPAAAPCHNPNYDDAVCQTAIRNWNESTWRGDQPGAVQWTNWEAWPEHNESCYIDTARDQPCRQGRLSVYSVAAEQPEDIQSAVRFASFHNIRLAIKNTGHCFLGRSTAPRSLQIWTHKLKEIDFTDDFHLSVSSSCISHSNKSQGPAVTIGAGVQLSEMYKEAAKRGKIAVMGVSHTVGAAGGFIQGGGHSPLGPWKGMASDNALEFKVVTAEGTLVTANQHQNQDLFWALRGGGGGTFGVVVSVTLRTFPDPHAYTTNVSLTFDKSEQEGFWKVVEMFHEALPALSDAGGSGYYSMTPTSETTKGTSGSALTLALFFIDVTETRPRQVLDDLVHRISAFKPGTNYTLELNPHFGAAVATGLSEVSSDPGGGVVVVASRLISREFLLKDSGPQRLVQALKDIYAIDKTVAYTGHMIAGGAVATNPGHVASGLNPAWRKTISHISFARDWNSNATLAEQRQVQHTLTHRLLRPLRDLEPDMGAYLNEADANELDFQRSFWGENYERLYRIKQAVDPKGLFISRKGVGSEDWDDAGLCRVKSGY